MSRAGWGVRSVVLLLVLRVTATALGVGCAAAETDTSEETHTTSGGASPPLGGFGGAASGGSGGAGGFDCAVDLCPGVDVDCRQRACVDDACGFEDAPAGAPCDDGAIPEADVCNGAGTCVECVTSPECATGFCQAGLCVPPSCADGEHNGDETDVDCGGTGMPAGCAPCLNGFGCGMRSDCVSAFCQAGSCAPCAGHADCAVDAFCDAGVCLPKLVLGDICNEAAQCASAQCVDAACCSSACGATCQACVAAQTGVANGSCSPVSAGTDPENECSNGMCDGSGNCDFDAGVACTLGSECLSGHCTDGACCDSACLGSCQACDLPGSVGSCTLIASGTDPDDECAGGDCNGNGGCVLSGQSCLSSAECATGFCVDGVCCASACNGSCEACNLAGTIGVCSLVPTGQDPAAECGNGVCGGDGSCNANNGEPCAQGADCVSNFCVDDVCCNSPCTGTCQACTAALKGAGSDGSCGNIAAASDPQDECPGTSGCSGSGACTLLASGSPCSFAGECASNFCVDGVCCSSICGGNCQACTAALKGSGADGVCGNIASGLDPNNECAGPVSCNGSGACATLANGSTCGGNAECSSGFCIDGYCCNTSCTNLCAACSAVKKGSGANGTCGAIAANTDPDNECPGLAVCNGAGQLCKLPNGELCATAADCSSNNCVDGVCCNTSCTGICQACSNALKGSGSDGACGNISIGTDPNNECFGSLSCSGAGACLLQPNGSACGNNAECTSNFCVDGVCCNSVCNSLCNACTALKKGSGADGTCGVIAANTDPDGECAGVLQCNGSGVCRLPLGEACLLTSDCISNHCVDGVCCSATCTGSCQACTMLLKGSGVDGICGNIAAGTDPQNECFASATCSGAGSCSLLPTGSTCSNNGECQSGFCVDGFCCNSVCNSLCNACSTAKKSSGADGTCGTIAANTDPDGECAGALACNGSGLCRAPLGEMCVLPADCISNYCVDGVCCSAACTGTCQACTMALKGSGSDGICGNIAGGTDPQNECFGALSCSGAGSCALLANGAACGVNAECTSNFCVDGVCCNNACGNLCNACTAVKKGSGADGTCGVIAAATDPDSECPGATLCSGSSSCSLFSNGTACSINGECASGSCVDGVCCNSPCNGLCQACTTAKKGSGLNGVCGDVATGTDPDNECANPPNCAPGGMCGP